MFMTGCGVSQTDFNKLSSRIDVIDVRLYDIEKDLQEMQKYLNEKHEFDKKTDSRQSEKNKKLQEQIDLHEKKLNAIAPVIQ